MYIYIVFITLYNNIFTQILKKIKNFTIRDGKIVSQIVRHIVKTHYRKDTLLFFFYK